MPIVRLPGGELRDEIRQPLHDTVDITAATPLPGVRTFFQDVTGKSLAQTNLTTTGGLPIATSFRIQGIALDAHNVLAAQQQLLPLMIENSSLVLKVGEKDYWRGAARFAAGRFYQDLDAAAAPAMVQQFGWAAVAPIVYGAKHVIDVNPLQAFSVVMTTDALSAEELTAIGTIGAGRKIRLVTSLKGLLRRPVQ